MSGETRDEMRDLMERLEAAERRLRVMVDDAVHRSEVNGDAFVLQGKVEGVRLALMYVREMTPRPSSVLPVGQVNP